MGIKFGLPTNSGELSPEAMEDIKALIVSVYKQSVANLESAVANLRMEVADLKQQLQDKSYLLDVMEPYIRKELLKEIEALQKQSEDMRKEEAYKKFFSGDMGFLYLFADILSGLSEIIRTQPTEPVELIRLYGRNFSSVANKLIILKKTVESLPESQDLSTMSIDELLALRNNYDTSKKDCDSPELFYTILWKASAELISQLCSQDFEDSIESNPGILEIFKRHILSLQETLTQNGVKIVARPDEETADLFKPTATDEIPSKPLIYREKDKYVYTYGLLNELKPYILND